MEWSETLPGSILTLWHLRETGGGVWECRQRHRHSTRSGRVPGASLAALLARSSLLQNNYMFWNIEKKHSYMIVFMLSKGNMPRL